MSNSSGPIELGGIVNDISGVHQLVSSWSDSHPERIAVVDADRQLTYGELEERANQLAHFLLTNGIERDQFVGLYLPRSAEFVVAALAVLKVGGAYLPLDPQYPSARVRTMLDSARPSWVFTTSQLAPNLPDGFNKQPIDTMDCDHLPVTDPGVRIDSANLAYVIYTSGSTGAPKGVMIPHQGILRLIDDNDSAQYTRFGSDEVFYLHSALSFDAVTYEIWGALGRGGRLVIGPPSTPSLAELGKLLRNNRVTQLFLTTGLFHLIVDERLHDLRLLKNLLFGGDVLSPERLEIAVSRLTRTRLVHVYGPTECTTYSTYYPISSGWQRSGSGDSVPIGYPIARTTVRILDERMRLVGPGEAGQLYIGGDGLARGYLADPALTATRFVPDPYSSEPGARLYATGDRARYTSDGAVDFLGRIDHQVKIRGQRVEPVEIEEALRGHDAVRDVVVMPTQADAENRRLAAFVVLNSDLVSSATSVDQKLTEIRKWMADRYPSQMVPDLWHCLPKLPLNSNAKIDRARLKELL